MVVAGRWVTASAGTYNGLGWGARGRGSPHRVLFHPHARIMHGSCTGSTAKGGRDTGHGRDGAAGCGGHTPGTP